jgi:hypothetical protein
MDGTSVNVCREAITRWVKKSTGPVAETVDSAAALKEAEGKADTVVLGYFKSFDKDDSAYTTFVSAAADIDATILQTTKADVAKAAGNLEQGSVALIKNIKVQAPLI